MRLFVMMHDVAEAMQVLRYIIEPLAIRQLFNGFAWRA